MATTVASTQTYPSESPLPSSTTTDETPASATTTKYDPLADLTPKQLETFHTLRAELDSEGIVDFKNGDTFGTEDHILLRFLRARKYDLAATKSMVVKCQEWRKTAGGVGIDKLYEETDVWDFPEREMLFTYWPLYNHKTDKLGRPINIEPMGSIDLPALYQHMTPERHRTILTLITESLHRETLPACSRAAGEGKLIDNGLCIVDLKGFGLGQFWQIRSLAKEQFQISQDCYPETMGKLIVINAPTTFTYIWSVAKRWLAPETIAKCDILGTQYEDVLLELVDKENLPAVYGGSCTCEGMGGCVLSNAGPWKKS